MRESKAPVEAFHREPIVLPTPLSPRAVVKRSLAADLVEGECERRRGDPSAAADYERALLRDACRVKYRLWEGKRAIRGDGGERSLGCSSLGARTFGLFLSLSSSGSSSSAAAAAKQQQAAAGRSSRKEQQEGATGRSNGKEQREGAAGRSNGKEQREGAAGRSSGKEQQEQQEQEQQEQ